jgi:acetyl/propionyl-CoA carboxylase alpha subunit
MKRVLIINRGEIAIRIAKALNELGHVSVGVWTDNEPEAIHLEYCKEWIHLTGASNTETYLNKEKIFKLIEEYKIDAVHPGYGFLAENAGFVKSLSEKGIIFIGPHHKAIELMGDKAQSKKLAKQAGVPTVPGSIGEIDSSEEAKKIALEIKYPVLLKAVAGGGGKGMRVCHSAEELDANFEAVRREALSSFGYGGVLVEKYILNPHHIEVQVLGDKKGNIFHLFERECSVQRRHQKVIEEAPSAFIGENEQLRTSICETAVRLARAVDYDSAGTVEFIMDEDKSFYFLEMNTRIQVEHPITEEVTGIDLMTNMIQAAFGEALDIKNQEEISLRGHSIECRICAEDPISMLPAPGVVTGFETTFPQGIRFDHCIYAGVEITPDFDPMIGKLVATGINREVAMRKIRSALKGLIIRGLKTNQALHEVLLNSEEFISGNYTTNLIAQKKPGEKLIGKSIVDLNSLLIEVALQELL